VTIRCEYDHAAADVLIMDPMPLSGAVVLAFLVFAFAVGFARWARRPAGAQPPADHGQTSSG
jgi:hypothetical protein